MVKFDQLQVPADAMLNLSYEQFQTAIAEIAVLCCAEMVGLSQLLLDDTVDYVKQREQFGVPIGSFQAIQHGLVDCYSGLEQMRSLLYRTLILETDSDSEWRGNVMGAKAFIAEGADLIARKAVQYHGAMGITDEVSIGHAMKRIIILARLFGDASNNLNQYLDIA
jgi:alkylation response protein AidB-like acyl-CoA dehydrogenase